MKRLFKLTSIPAVALAALACLSSVTYATKPAPIVLDFYFNRVDMAANVASGSFTATSTILKDEGTGVEIYHLTPPNPKGEQSVSGVKTLSGKQGNIIMRMEVHFTPLNPPGFVVLDDERTGLIISQGTGRFVILSGTEAYANLHGEGSAEAKLIMIVMIGEDGNFVPTGEFALTGKYTGQAHLDP
jgi:hypothetical protein